MLVSSASGHPHHHLHISICTSPSSFHHLHSITCTSSSAHHHLHFNNVEKQSISNGKTKKNAKMAFRKCYKVFILFQIRTQIHKYTQIHTNTHIYGIYMSTTSSTSSAVGVVFSLNNFNIAMATARDHLTITKLG